MFYAQQSEKLDAFQILYWLTEMLSKLSPNERNQLTALHTHSFKKPVENISEQEAIDIVNKLMEKEKVVCAKKNWKQQQINYLVYIVDKYCVMQETNVEELCFQDWQTISNYIPQRDGQACLFRFLSLSPSSLTVAPWSNLEKLLLLRIIQNQSGKADNWRKISELLYQENKHTIYRTGKQCRQHYTCFLKPHLKKGVWTQGEDYQLINLFLVLGRKWSRMTPFITGRNQNAIKNRFFLMFQNKKYGKVGHSDLLKLVKLRKQKIQQRLLSHDQFNNAEVLLALSCEQANSSTLNNQPQMPTQSLTPPRESSIFLSDYTRSFTEQQQLTTRMNRQELQFICLNYNEEFQQYISL